MKAKTGLLIATNSIHIGKILPTIGKQVENILYIYLINEIQESFERYRSDKLMSASKYSQTVQRIYLEISTLCPNLDVRVFLSGFKNSTATCLSTSRQIEVVIFDKLLEKEYVDWFLKSYVPYKMPECTVMTIENNEPIVEVECKKITMKHDYKVRKHVFVGGTFDRLHVIHKILLTETIFRAKEKVTVGVSRIDNGETVKTLPELIEPLQVRLKNVKNFMNDVCSELNYDVIPLCVPDLMCFMKSDPTLEMMVVGIDSLSWTVKSNEIRQNNGLPTLEIVSVGALGGQENGEEKIRSTINRKKLLGTLLQPVGPKVDEHGPYVIGLTGGICSGKSHISAELVKLGATIIECDKIAYELHNLEKSYYNNTYETFGNTVTDCNEPFHNKIIWPAIEKEIKDRICKLHKAGHKVIVIEAAVLLQTGWDTICHEVWSCIIPPDEAIKRLINRNKLSKETAKTWLASQMTNSEYVAKANVVFCSLWSFEFTQMTVERAWTLLKERLPGKHVN